MSTAAPITIESLAQRIDSVLEQMTAPAPRFLTVDGAAAHCSLSPESIRRFISSGKLQPYRPAKGRVLLDRIALEQFVLSADARPRVGRGLR